ncbi:hypothetical protein IEQ34_009889 [Dendrobium chrysotoxum]|uniref:Wall-associated receptor kinase galacturonan-binding domain-containing protein n=1 Tax=Dendrobium chrysotoxum TaxID=161865 RepID=A0AAV7GKK2_DENCH|nr:hypothetical protein IEQ34_009889 [Dendrobium chrysotoxum]
MAPPSPPTTLLLPLLLLLLLLLPLLFSFPLIPSSPTCRSYCGNITIDYPFSLHSGCGHPAFRQLLFCINSLLLLHIPSGSYRVLSIDYAFRRLTLNDPTMSDCYSLAPNTSPAHGFITNPSLSKFLQPAPDNVFFLLGCRRDSPLFQLGFPDTRVCGNVSGMGCEDYYRCPAWEAGGRSAAYGTSNPPECCSVAAGVVREVNLTRLRCAAYSSAYSIAPVRARGPGEWDYGIRVAYSVPGDDETGCRACRVSGGSCGYDDTKVRGEEDVDYGVVMQRLCICGGGIDAWNSTTTCESVGTSEGFVVKQASIVNAVLRGWLVCATGLLAI